MPRYDSFAHPGMLHQTYTGNVRADCAEISREFGNARQMGRCTSPVCILVQCTERYSSFSCRELQNTVHGYTFDWESMIETMAGNYLLTSRILRLIKIQRQDFSDQEYNVLCETGPPLPSTTNYRNRSFPPSRDCLSSNRDV